MGGAAVSTLQQQPDAQGLADLRASMALLLAAEFKTYKEQNLSETEVKEKIAEALIRQEEELLGKKDAESKKSTEDNSAAMSSLELKLAKSTATRTLEERSTYLIDDIDSHAQILLHKKEHNFLVCVDGSETADQAFKTACHLLKKNYKISMFHAFNSDSLKNLPPMFTPEFIRQKYESQLISKLVEANYNFNWEERGPSESVLDALNAFIRRLPYNEDTIHNKNLPDFVVMGYVGRKGPKGPPPRAESLGSGVADREVSMITDAPDNLYNSAVVQDSDSNVTADFGNASLGSTCYEAIRALPLPCIICKRPLKKLITNSDPHQGRHHTNYHRPVSLSYLMAVNSSPSSKKGLEILLSLVKSCDSITLIHVKNVDAEVRLSQFASDSTPFGSDDEEEDTLEPLPDDSVATDGVFLDDSDVRMYYREQLRVYGPKKSKFKTINIHSPPDLDRAASVYKVQRTLVSYVNRAKPDFFAIAPRAKIDYSSVTEYVLSNVTSSIIICRN